MTIQYTLKFTGSINQTFRFIVTEENGEDWEYGRQSDLDKYVEKRSDGYLYIQGHRITNDIDGIRTIYRNLAYAASRNVGSGYVDSNFTIDSFGYVICTYHYYGTNQADRYMDKFMKWLT